MKKFNEDYKLDNKINKNNIDNQLDEEKFNNDLKEIKEKVNAETLSEEFKNNLKLKLEDEYYKTTEKKKNKTFSFPNFAKQLATTFACFVILFSSYLVLADDIDNVILKIFSDSDKIAKDSIENGNYKEINMEYIENNGVSIKVDYLIINDDNIYIAFDACYEEKIDRIFIGNMNIKDQENIVLYSSEYETGKFNCRCEEISINNKNAIIIYKLSKIDYNIDYLTKLKFEINNIDFCKDNKGITKDGKWEFEINL